MNDGMTEAAMATMEPPPPPNERALRAAPYLRQSLETLHEAGIITLRPHGVRVLLRAILEEDAYTSLEHAPYDARQAIAHEVVALGGSVDKWYEENGVEPDDRISVGDHVFVLSTAADRASKTDKACRLWLVHVEDVSAFWRIPALTLTSLSNVSR